MTIAMLALGNTMAQERGLKLEGYGEVGVNTEPHVLVGASCEWRGGWSAFGEAEYDKGVEVTQLFVQKTLGKHMTLRVGKMTMPMGAANLFDAPTDHFGVALPMGEAMVLPTQCNRMGLALLHKVGAMSIEAQALVCDGQTSALLRVEHEARCGLHVGISAHHDGALTLGADWRYAHAAMVARGTATFSAAAHAVHVGAECGCDLLHQAKGRLMAFARYDYAKAHTATIGLNYLPLAQIVLKTELAHTFGGAGKSISFAMSVGLTLP